MKGRRKIFTLQAIKSIFFLFPSTTINGEKKWTIVCQMSSVRNYHPGKPATFNNAGLDFRPGFFRWDSNPVYHRFVVKSRPVQKFVWTQIMAPWRQLRWHALEGSWENFKNVDEWDIEWSLSSSPWLVAESKEEKSRVLLKIWFDMGTCAKARSSIALLTRRMNSFVYGAYHCWDYSCAVTGHK